MEIRDTRRTGRLIARGGCGRAESGMTLIEIMIVLAIIALVMGFLVGPKILAELKEAKIKTARLAVKDLAEAAYTRWAADHSDESCPSALEDLKKYTNTRTFKDPWGTKFGFLCGEGLPEGIEFGVFSLGPNRKEGTDDIKSWDIEGGAGK